MTWLMRTLLVVQAALGMRVITRLIRTARGDAIETATHSGHEPGGVAVLLPVLNEAGRILPCLESLTNQGRDVARIIVVDGGSIDGTPAIVSEFSARDDRITLIAANETPPGLNGKAHQLEAGRQQATGSTPWLLTIDADVRIDSRLVPSMLRYAANRRLTMLSVATKQRLPDTGSGLLHPAFLTSLVYRTGIPGHTATRAEDAQANGQCCLFDGAALADVGGFARVVDSLCEDVTLARVLASRGYAVGFAEDQGLAKVEMYADWREMWNNWPRSLALRDRFTYRSWLVGAGEVVAAQALPLPIVVLGLRVGAGKHPVVRLNLGLLIARLGVLAGTRRAYLDPPRSYWLSPLVDLPVAFALLKAGFRRQHHWRGRIMSRGGTR